MRSEWGGYPVCYHSAVWDPLHEQMLVFGGSSGAWYPLSGQNPEIWAYSPSKGAWTRKADKPLGDGLAAVWDTKNNQAILFAGSILIYNPATDTWGVRASGPSRQDHRIVWDSQNNQMILFGGSDGYSTMYNDVWIYDPSKDNWTMKVPSGNPPSVRLCPSAAWDDQNNQMLVFGGSYYDGSTTHYLNDLYAYKPSTNSWTFLGNAPRSVRRHVAVWDSIHNQMIICGGECENLDFNDTWAYIPATNRWVQLQPQLGFMRDHTVVWDELDSQMLVFGGQSGSGALGELRSFAVPCAPVGEITAASRLLSENIVSIDRVDIGASVPDGTSVDLWARAADSTPSWKNWTPIESGSRPAVSGKYFQWKAVLNSPQRHRTPTLDNLTVSFTTNIFPVVRAEGELAAYRKETVFLNASASDSDGDQLSFFWEQISGSPVGIDDPGEANTTFVADLMGIYSFSFIAMDSFGKSPPAFVNVSILNIPPVAAAPPRLIAFRQQVVLLNGSGSDEDGDLLSFCWIQLSGTDVQLRNASSPVASFVPAVLGEFLFGLVVNDSHDDSVTARVSVLVRNRIPVAYAGKELFTHRREPVLLNGTGSDPDEDALTFTWSSPESLNAQLQYPGTAQPTFTPAKLGSFRFQLVVNDGYDDSAPSFVNVTVANWPPRADAGPDQTAGLNETVQLQGGGEDKDGDVLSFGWTQTGGTPVVLSNANKRVATFQARSPGKYSFILKVNDSIDESSDSVNITVVDRSHPPRFTSRPSTEAHPGRPYRYMVKYADDGGTDACQLTLLSGPQGMALSSGEIAWTPGDSQEGVYNASLALTDGSSTVHQNWTIVVASGTDRPAPGFPSSIMYAAFGTAILVAVAACIAILVVRKRRRPPAQAPADSPTPDASGMGQQMPPENPRM
jgi:hypothetical protein